MSSEEPVDRAEGEVGSSSQQVAGQEGADAQDADAVVPTNKSTGRVKWFSVTKGFGFIEPDEGEGEIFVHQTSILAEGFRSLKEDEPVEFDLDVSDGGRQKAMNVTGPGGAPPEGAPRRVVTAPPYPMMAPQPYMYNPYAPYPPMYRAPSAGRFPAGRGFGGRGGYGYGRGGYPAVERPPPPGTPGVSSGYQVVVHNLPWAITWQELKDIFSVTPGVVRADVIVDSNGRSRGFGTVRYQTREEAQAAADMMNNVEVGNRIVSVRIDRFA